MNLWIVGRNIGCVGAWEFQVVFDSEEAADGACVDVYHFYAPAALNETIPQESGEWTGCVRPRQVINAL